MWLWQRCRGLRRNCARSWCGTRSRRMPDALRKEVLRIAEGAACTAGEISQLNFRLGVAFADAVVAACREFRVALSRVDLIGSHGQTIFHQGRQVPFLGRATASTLQIGEPAVIAARDRDSDGGRFSGGGYGSGRPGCAAGAIRRLSSVCEREDRSGVGESWRDWEFDGVAGGREAGAGGSVRHRTGEHVDGCAGVALYTKKAEI